MYSAWLSTKSSYPLGKCVYDNSVAEPEITFIDPVLNLSAGAAGEFTFGIAPTQVYYDSFEKMTSIISVVRDGRIIWEGRIIDEEMDFYKTKNFTCEGALAYFNDTDQGKRVSGTDLPVFIKDTIAYHNAQCGTEKHKIFKFLYCSPVDNITEPLTTNYESTLEVLNNIAETYNGLFHITWNEYGEKCISFYTEEDRKIVFKTSSQVIEFGKNLLDYTHSYDLTQLCTVVIPIGDEVVTGEDDAGKEVKAPLDLSMANYDGEWPGHIKGTPYIMSEEAVASYGWIVKKVEFDGVTDPSTLYYLGLAYLEKGQFANMSIEISAFDLGLLQPKVDGLPVIPESPEASEHPILTSDGEELKTSNGETLYTKY